MKIYEKNQRNLLPIQIQRPLLSAEFQLGREKRNDRCFGLDNSIFTKRKARHLLGVGEVDDIFEIIQRGVDTFDCVIPTRMVEPALPLFLQVRNF